jgi:predicted methyltransferase
MTIPKLSGRKLLAGGVLAAAGLLAGAASAQLPVAGGNHAAQLVQNSPAMQSVPAAVQGQTMIAAYVLAAINDPSRPLADRERDAARKPAEVMAFAGLRPGDTVVDLIPGGGYFTRIFSRIAGPGGKVYALVPAALAEMYPQAVTAAQAVTKEPAYANVTVLVEGVGKLASHGQVDMVWTSQNYHDLHGPKLAPDTAVEVDKAVFAALKPGGTFVIEDHVAEPGSGARDAGALHRIDPELVRKEVTSVGFIFAGETQVLRNPADNHTLKVFDPAIRGHTDQFVMKFRKPI